jgi:hypothetical protein
MSEDQQKQLRERLELYRQYPVSDSRQKSQKKTSSVLKPSNRMNATQTTTKLTGSTIGKPKQVPPKSTSRLSSSKKVTLKAKSEVSDTIQPVTVEHIKIATPEQAPSTTLVDTVAMEENTFKNRLHLYGLQRIYVSVGEALEVVRLPRLLLFSLADAIGLAEGKYIEAARSVFRILAKTTLESHYNYVYCNKTWKLLKKPFSHQYEFWTTWAKYEEQWGNLNEVADIYFDAIDQLKDREEVMKLREEYYAFQTRIGFIKSEIEIDDDVQAPELVSEHRNVEEILKKSIPESVDSDWKPSDIQFHSEPQVKSENIVNDIVDMLGAMSIRKEPKSLPEMEFEMEIPSMNPKTPSKKVVGVPVSARKNGSSVTVLTPVKASRKTKMELGVDQVITPVRRSLRLFNQEDYVAGTEGSSTQAPTREKVAKLLENHGYAYVPNKVVICNEECRV